MTFETPRAEITEPPSREERALADAIMYVRRGEGLATAAGVREQFFVNLKGMVELYEFDNDTELTIGVKE